MIISLCMHAFQSFLCLVHVIVGILGNVIEVNGGITTVWYGSLSQSKCSITQSLKMMKRTSLLLSLFLVLVFTSSFCFAEDDETESVIKHPAKNVIERRLVLEKANTKIILKENKNYAAATEKKNFQGDTLAYVTPW